MVELLFTLTSICNHKLCARSHAKYFTSIFSLNSYHRLEGICYDEQ